MKKRNAILLIVVSAVFGLMLGLIPGIWSKKPPSLALTQLAELHLNHGNRAEAFTCFVEAHRLAPDEGTRARCLDGAKLAKTTSELVDVIDLDGAFVHWWFNESHTQLLALGENGILLYDLVAGAELDRCSFGAEIEIYTSPTTNEIPSWIAVGTVEEHVEIFQFPDFARCELARKIEGRELFSVSVLGSPPNERLEISEMNKGFKLLNPKKAFETELETIDGNNPALSPDGKLLAYFQEQKARLWNLQTQRLKVEALLEGPSFDRLTFGPDGRQLMVLTGEHLEIVDTNTGETVKSVEHQGRWTPMIIKDWFPISGAAYATMSRSQDVKFWDINEASFAKIRGPNRSLAWSMLTTGATAEQAQEAQKSAKEFFLWFDQQQEILVDGVEALIQRSDDGLTIYALPEGKVALHDIHRVFCDVFHWQEEGGVLSQLSANGTLTQHALSHQNGRWKSEELAILQLPVSKVRKFAPLKSNRFAVTRLGTSRIEIWKTQAPNVIRHPRGSYSVFHSDGIHVMKSNSGRTPHSVINLDEARVVRKIESIRGDCGGISSDGRFCLTLHKNEVGHIEVRVENTVTGETLGTQIVEQISQSSSRRGVDIASPNGILAFSGFLEGEWKQFIWDPNKAAIHELPSAPGSAFPVAGGSGLLSLASQEDSVFFWNLNSNLEPTKLPFPDTFRLIFAAPDLDYLYIGADSGRIGVWNPESGELIREVSHSELFDIYIVPNGKGVLVAITQSECEMWEEGMTQPRWRRRDPNWTYEDARFSDDGEILFVFNAGGSKPSFRAISTADGSTIVEIQAEGHFKDARFRPDSHEVAILLMNSVVLWDIDSGQIRKVHYERPDSWEVWYDGDRVVLSDEDRIRILPTAASFFEIERINLARRTGFHFRGGELLPMTRSEWQELRRLMR